MSHARRLMITLETWIVFVRQLSALFRLSLGRSRLSISCTGLWRCTLKYVLLIFQVPVLGLCKGKWKIVVNLSSNELFIQLKNPRQVVVATNRKFHIFFIDVADAWSPKQMS
jgi:hypothetical protein